MANLSGMPLWIKKREREREQVTGKMNTFSDRSKICQVCTACLTYLTVLEGGGTTCDMRYKQAHITYRQIA